MLTTFPRPFAPGTMSHLKSNPLSPGEVSRCRTGVRKLPMSLRSTLFPLAPDARSAGQLRLGAPGLLVSKSPQLLAKFVAIAISTEFVNPSPSKSFAIGGGDGVELGEGTGVADGVGVAAGVGAGDGVGGVVGVADGVEARGMYPPKSVVQYQPYGLPAVYTRPMPITL